MCRSGGAVADCCRDCMTLGQIKLLVEFFEVLLPDAMQKYGLAEDITVDRDGLVHAPVEVMRELVSADPKKDTGAEG